MLLFDVQLHKLFHLTNFIQVKRLIIMDYYPLLTNYQTLKKKYSFFYISLRKKLSLIISSMCALPLEIWKDCK